MIPGSWLKAHGSSFKARGSGLMAHGQEEFGARARAWETFLGHEPWALSHKPRGMSRMPRAMSHEPLTVNDRLINELLDYL